MPKKKAKAEPKRIVSYVPFWGSRLVTQIVESCTVAGLTRKLRETETRLQRLDPASSLDAIIAADPSHPWAQDYRMLHNAVLRAQARDNGLRV